MKATTDQENIVSDFDYSVLKNMTSFEVETFPFPHIVIQDALPSELAFALTRDFPINEFDLNKNNKRYDISASSLNSFPNISSQWKSLIEFHSSKEFFLQIVELFKDHIPIHSLRENLDLKKYHIGQRGTDLHSGRDLLMDAQISINSPVIKEGSVRQIHVDNSNKLFSGLLYLRQDSDESSGGNLQLFSWNSEYSHNDKLKFYKEGVDKKHCVLEKEIPYQNNTCILFINSLDALHGVTPRAKTNNVRTFVNLVGELPYDFYRKHSFLQHYLLNLRALLVQLKHRIFY